MASGKKALLQDISDQFLQCKICFEDYKSPKTLECLHTFCTNCLDKHADSEYERSYRYMVYGRSVTCPICRKRTELPSGGIRRLPDNFLVTNLNDVINRVKPSKVPQCEICKSFKKTTVDACSKCLECAKLLCKSCVEQHRKTKVTQDHSLFDVQVEKDIECKVHPEECVRFYCEPCETCVCVLCTFQEHKDHELSSFTEGISRNRKSLENLSLVCQDRINKVKSHLDLINKCEYNIKDVEDKIRDVSLSLVQAIRNNQKNMVENLRNIYGPTTLAYLRHKENIKDNLEDLQSTVNLTNLILKEKSVEVLLLKKNLEEKTQGLISAEILDPPAGIEKQVRFVPGSVALGYIDTGQNKNNDSCDGESENKREQFKISNFSELQTQTERIETTEKDTTMCKLCIDYCLDIDTQTDIVSKMHKETETPVAMTKGKCTSTDPPSVSHKGCTTDEKSFSKAKTQTDVVEMIDQDVSTINVTKKDVEVGTPLIRTINRGTIPYRAENYRDKKSMTPVEWMENKPTLRDIKSDYSPAITIETNGIPMVAKETITTQIPTTEMSTSTYGVQTVEMSTTMEGDDIVKIMPSKPLKPCMVDGSTLTNVPTENARLNAVAIETKTMGTEMSIIMKDTGVNPDPAIKYIVETIKTDSGTMPDTSISEPSFKPTKNVPLIETCEMSIMTDPVTIVTELNDSDAITLATKRLVKTANASTITDSGLTYANLVLTGSKKKPTKVTTVDKGANTVSIEALKPATVDTSTETDAPKYTTTASDAIKATMINKKSNTPTISLETKSMNTVKPKSFSKHTTTAKYVMKEQGNMTDRGTNVDESTATEPPCVEEVGVNVVPEAVVTKDRGTDAKRVYMVERRVGTEPLNTKANSVATSTDTIEMKTKQTLTPAPSTRDRSVCTPKVEMVTIGTKPFRFPKPDKHTMTTSIATVSKETETTIIKPNTTDTGVDPTPLETHSKETETYVPTMDEGTSTGILLTTNKNVGTDNTQCSDAQVGTSYILAINWAQKLRQKALTNTRGTCTPQVKKATSETNTMIKKTSNNETTTNTNVHTSEAGTSTPQVPKMTTSQTNTPTIVHATKETTTNKGMNTINSSTGMVPIKLLSRKTNTPSKEHISKFTTTTDLVSLETTATGDKSVFNNGVDQYVNTLPIDVQSQTTSTDGVIRQTNQETSTERVNVMNQGSNTNVPDQTSKQTTTNSCMVTHERAIGCGNQANEFKIDMATDAVTIETNDASTRTIQTTKETKSVETIPCETSNQHTNTNPVVNDSKETTTEHLIGLQTLGTSTGELHRQSSIENSTTTNTNVHVQSLGVGTQGTYLEDKQTITDPKTMIDQTTRTIPIISTHQGTNTESQTLNRSAPDPNLDDSTGYHGNQMVDKETHMVSKEMIERSTTTPHTVTTDMEIVTVPIGEQDAETVTDSVSTSDKAIFAGVRKQTSSTMTTPNDSTSFNKNLTSDNSTMTDITGKISLGTNPDFKLISKKEEFWEPMTVQPGNVQAATSSFISQPPKTAKSIVWKVDRETMTRARRTATSSTRMTPPPSTQERGVGTDSVVVEGRINECISKLKNVTQRLNNPPPSTQERKPIPITRSQSTYSPSENTVDKDLTITRCNSEKGTTSTHNTGENPLVDTQTKQSVENSPDDVDGRRKARQRRPSITALLNQDSDSTATDSSTAKSSQLTDDGSPLPRTLSTKLHAKHVQTKTLQSFSMDPDELKKMKLEKKREKRKKHHHTSKKSTKEKTATKDASNLNNLNPSGSFYPESTTAKDDKVVSFATRKTSSENEDDHETKGVSDKSPQQPWRQRAALQKQRSIEALDNVGTTSDPKTPPPRHFIEVNESPNIRPNDTKSVPRSLDNASVPEPTSSEIHPWRSAKSKRKDKRQRNKTVAIEMASRISSEEDLYINGSKWDSANTRRAMTDECLPLGETSKAPDADFMPDGYRNVKKTSICFTPGPVKAFFLSDSSRESSFDSQYSPFASQDSFSNSGTREPLGTNDPLYGTSSAIGTNDSSFTSRKRTLNRSKNVQ